MICADLAVLSNDSNTSNTNEMQILGIPSFNILKGALRMGAPISSRSILFQFYAVFGAPTIGVAPPPHTHTGKSWFRNS